MTILTFQKHDRVVFARAPTICGLYSVVRERRHVRHCGHCWWIASTARPCSSPGPAATRSPATARSAGCWRPAPGPLPLVAPTGFDHDASLFELEFEGLALVS
jgi:hypothetical protein